MRRLIDSHVHMESLGDPEVIVQLSKDSGIDAVICVGGSLESSKVAKRLALEHPGFLYPALGVHPSEVLKEDIDSAVAYLRENLGGCIAVGEIGLDYAYSFAKPKDVRARMRSIFSRFLEVAAELDLPASIHSRSAYKDSLELAAGAGVEGVFHWYDGPLHTLKDILDAGFYVSATPSVAYSKGARAVMTETPLEKILVETDSPVYLRNLDRRSTPADVRLVVDALADLKGLDASEVSMVTAKNAESLFRLL
jgi:TatD DNase family protein